MTIDPQGLIGASSARSREWKSLDWVSIRQQVRRLQMRIAKAIKERAIEYFEKRRCFAWRTYPVGKARAFRAGTDKLATQDATEQKPDCRITSAEADLRKA